MKPLDPGLVFDALERRGSRTVVHLSRPLDLAPDGGTRWTVPQLAALVRDTAARLAAAGARPGEHVAIVKRNHWDCVLLACAAARIGAVPALLSDHLAPHVLVTLLGRLRPAVLVTQAPLLRTAADAGADLAGHAAHTVVLDRPGPDAAPYATAFHELPAEPAAPVHRRHDDEPLTVLHTSGTTGVPKLVTHSTRTLIRRLAAFEAHPWPVLTPRRSDTVASATSFVHGRALAWTVSTLWHQPAKVVILADADPTAGQGTAPATNPQASPTAAPGASPTAGQRPTPSLSPAPDPVAAALRAHPPTFLEALPATYVRWQPLAAEPDGPFRDVRLHISTFDAVHPPTVRAFLAASRRARPVWMQGWGQTETGPLTFRFLTRRALARRAERHPTTRNLGRPVPGWVGLRVVDPETFRPVPRGQIGLVLTRTKARCLGYLGEQDRWREKAHGDWFNTGDLAVHTRGGALLLHDREVDMVPGLSCVELEDVLHDRLPEVEEAVVLGGVDRAPQPVLVLNSPLDPARWQVAVRDLPGLAEPLTLERDAVPRTATGKVRRHELRDRYLSGSAAHGTGRWT